MCQRLQDIDGDSVDARVAKAGEVEGGRDVASQEASETARAAGGEHDTAAETAVATSKSIATNEDPRTLE